MNDRIPFLVGDDPGLATWFDVPDPATLDADLVQALGAVQPPAIPRAGAVVARGHAVPATSVPGFRPGPIVRLARVAEVDGGARSMATYAAVADGAQGIVMSIEASDVADPAALDEAMAFDPRATAWVVELGCSVSPQAALGAIRAVGDRRGQASLRPWAVRCDPWVASLANDGALDAASPPDETLSALADVITTSAVPVWTADARGVDGRGAGTVARLAYVLASLSATAAALGDAGVDVAAASGVVVVWPTGLLLLEEVAALRALRLGWAGLAAAWGAPSLPLYVNATTSTTWLTQEDAANNTLRETLAVAAAMLGGADTVEVSEPGAGFDAARRLAVTGPAVLAWEARLDRLGDVGAGAATVEARTDALLQAAWALAASWDAAGGLSADAVRRAVVGACAEDREAAERDVRSRRQPIVGVSQSPAPSAGSPSEGAGWRRSEAWAGARRRLASAGVAIRPSFIGAAPPWRAEALAGFGALGLPSGPQTIALLLVGTETPAEVVTAAVVAARDAGARGVVVATEQRETFGADARWSPGDDVVEAVERALGPSEEA